MLADGAGGLSGGLEASRRIVDELSQADAREPEEWVARLRDLDRALHQDPRAGWSTAVALSIEGGMIRGASAGDSEAWRFGAETLIQLTAAQSRKPLLGTGNARPRGFSARLQRGERLLLASDGLVKYVDAADLWIDSLEPDLGDGARRMIQRARLKSGALRDDTSLILARASMQTRA